MTVGLNRGTGWTGRASRVRLAVVVKAVVVKAVVVLAVTTMGGCRVRRESDPKPADTGAVATVSAPTVSVSAPAPPPPPPPPPPPVEAPPGALVLALGGIDSRPEQSGSAERAVDTATQTLVSGATTLDAAVAGVVVLEDDPHLNAGTGSRFPLDGERPQMDAAVMESSGRFGAVCALEEVKNPVAVAARVADTPHLMICGPGAVAFARSAGFPDYDVITEVRRRERDALVAELVGGTGSLFGEVLRRDREPVPSAGGVSSDGGGAASRSADSSARVGVGGATPSTENPGGNAPSPGSDTVAVVVRSAEGAFAVAASTGGPAAKLAGRVGDVPVLGAALFAGPDGAVVLSGYGEDILRAQLARRIYERLEGGDDVDEATTWALDLISDDESIAIAIVGRKGHRLEVTQPVAWALRNAEGVRTGAPTTPTVAPDGSAAAETAAPVASEGVTSVPTSSATASAASASAPGPPATAPPRPAPPPAVPPTAGGKGAPQ